MDTVQPVSVESSNEADPSRGGSASWSRGGQSICWFRVFFLLGMGAWLNVRFPSLPVFQLLFTLVFAGHDSRTQRAPTPGLVRPVSPGHPHDLELVG